MAKIRQVVFSETNTQYLYYCVGCGYEHAFRLKPSGRHEWNGDFNSPTVKPSLLNNFTPGKTCHSFIQLGKIQYLSDCHHKLAGQTIDLPDYESDEKPILN